MWYYKEKFQFVNPFISVDTHERDVVGSLSMLLNNFPCYTIMGKIMIHKYNNGIAIM